VKQSETVNASEFHLVQTMHQCRRASECAERMSELLDGLEFAPDHNHDYDLDFHARKLRELLTRRLAQIEHTLNLKRFSENNPLNRRAFSA
jgi:hypothetical protein